MGTFITILIIRQPYIHAFVGVLEFCWVAIFSFTNLFVNSKSRPLKTTSATVMPLAKTVYCVTCDLIILIFITLES